MMGNQEEEINKMVTMGVMYILGNFINDAFKKNFDIKNYQSVPCGTLVY
jgi:hypothetical protein